MTLLLDSDALLTPALSFYAFDICGGYWTWVVNAAQNGDVKSISQVKRELRQKDDNVRNWIDFNASDLFLPDDASVGKNMSKVAGWANSNGFTPAAVAAFVGKADSFLIAYAMLRGYKIVTFEKSEPNARHRIKIPDAASAFGVSTITPFQMLRQHGVRL